MVLNFDKTDYEQYYCADNFFTKMTDLESPKKNNDCYFYYYSTCSKGDSCGFRHEPSALGSETMCSFWKEGKCLNVRCNFRHMELRKNRKAIKCYWEAQPGGCLKQHCPFMHQNPRPNSEDGHKSESEMANNYSSIKSTPSAIDHNSLVVKFEEESDSETPMPTLSPLKINPRVKTLEEIKLERIAAESAAYYSYPGATLITVPLIEETIVDEDDLRRKLFKHVKGKVQDRLDLKRTTSADSTGSTSNVSVKRKKPLIETTTTTTNIEDIKIKTLEEIRAERNAKLIIGNNEESTTTAVKRKFEDPSVDEEEQSVVGKKLVEEAEVTSTSNEEQSPDPESSSSILKKPIRKLNIKRLKVTKEKIEEQPQQEDSDGKVNEKLMEIETDKVQKIEETLKTLDESSLLLIDDAEEDASINIKSEDDLLGDIDSFLDD